VLSKIVPSDGNEAVHKQFYPLLLYLLSSANS